MDKRKQPFTSEHKRKISLSNKGKKYSDETKEKIRQVNLGSKSHFWKGGKPHCIECGIELTRKGGKYCASHKFRGERSTFWKGGITPIIILARNSFKYRQWRSDIFTRDDFTCQICGKKGCYLEADHYPKMFSAIFYEYNIKSLQEAIDCEELWNLNNGRTLCKECHDKTKKGCKSLWDIVPAT